MLKIFFLKINPTNHYTFAEPITIVSQIKTISSTCNIWHTNLAINPKIYLFIHDSRFSPYNCIATGQLIKMPKSKLFKHFVKKRNVVESLSQPSPPLPAETNPLVKQQQASAIGAQTPIPSTPGHFPKVTNRYQTR